jgi:2-keto-3-deoxy-L-arabinonate dehydratase
VTKNIRGVLPIVHTPFTDDDRIDVDSLHRELAWALERPIGGYCTGMVSELLRLSGDERNLLHREIATADRGDRVFVAGVGAESISQACAFAEKAASFGCDAVMVIPPVTVRTSYGQLRDYFSGIADAIDVPMIIQDASSYVGQAIPMQLNVELLDKYGEEKILFKPEASPLGPKLSELRDATGRRAKIFEGSGGISLMDSYRRGIKGTMPGMEFLDTVLAVWAALEAGDDASAYESYLPLCALVALQLQAGLEGFLATEKYVLHARGLFATDHRRQPYSFVLDDETRAEIDRLMKLAGL